MNPYSGNPDYTFWQRSVSALEPDDIDLVTDVPFTLGRTDAVATAGSCFAQHIARTLSAQGFNYLVTEGGPATPGAVDEGYGLFSARFGNIYTVRQLLQLFDRAYGLFVPVDRAWRGRRGGMVDPFRPGVQDHGFASAELLDEDRHAHLTAVRRMFENCRVFIFTLGLTEGWVSMRDGGVFPLAPGVGGVPEDQRDYAPRNFRTDDMVADLEEVLAKIRSVNREVRVILTVSPVPLMATFENRHVAVSTAYSKAALRVVAEEVGRGKNWVGYFPSYEIVTGHFNGDFFEKDGRNVRADGVARVMATFRKHYLGGAGGEGTLRDTPRLRAMASEEDLQRFNAIERVVCDEEAITRELDKA